MVEPFRGKLPQREAFKKNDGRKVEIFSPLPSPRPDRWIWVDNSSNNNLWIVSRIPNPWEGEVSLKIGAYRSSSKGGKRERHPLRCQLLVFPLQPGIPIEISREVYASAYAYQVGEALASLHFPWEKKEGTPQMWLSYGFFKL